MKAIFGMGMAVCVALAGCGNLFSPGEPSQPEPPNTLGSGQTPQEKVTATGDNVGTKGNYGGGPITEPIAQYFRLQDRIKLLQITAALKLYRAQHAGYPKSFEAFEQEILKPSRIKLPDLPRGHTYSFDSEKGELMVNRPRN